MEPEDVTTVTEGKVLMTPRGDVRVFNNSGNCTVNRLKSRKTKTTGSATVKSRRRKLKSAPKLVPAIKDDDCIPCEVKQEPDDEAAQMKKQMVVEERNIEVRKRKLKKKIVCDGKARTGTNIGIKIESSEAAEVGEVSSTKSRKVTKSVVQHNKNSAVTPEPPKKKRKV